MTITDPEISAMGAIAAALEPLDPDASARVLSWAWGRYAPDSSTPTASTPASDQAGPEATTGDSHQFDHFADLFDAVGPSSAADRLLVGCYWVQVIEGNESFGARAVNDLLKDVGHGLSSNVAKTFTRLQDQSPALVRQLSKSGRSQQARKTYKLTTAGISEIEGRL